MNKAYYLKSILGINTESRLKTSLGNLHLGTPLLTASGTFGYGTNYTRLKNFDLEMLGGIVLKSVTLKPREGNPEPRIVETPGGLINSIGIQNVGIEQLITTELPRIRKLKTNVIVSIAGNLIDEYAELASILSKNHDFEAIEVNISCPNVDKGGMLFSFDCALASQITKKVKKFVPNKPVIMKLSPNAPDIISVAVSCIRAGADVLALSNTFTALALDIYKKRPLLKRNFGGLSGPAIRPLSLAIFAKVSRYLKQNGIKIPLIGIGGILTYRDVLEYMIAGASAVEIGTSLFYRPDIFTKIYIDLKRHCDIYKINIMELIGTIQWY